MRFKVQESDCLPTGEYAGQLVELVEESHAQYGKRLRWRFRIVRGDYTGRELVAYSNASEGRQSKLMRWAGVLLGRALQPQEEFDSDDLVGKYCLLVVVRKARANGDGDTNVIEDIRPPRRPAPPRDEEGDPFA